MDALRSTKPVKLELVDDLISVEWTLIEYGSGTSREKQREPREKMINTSW
jgi:hypothetical protein